MKNNQETWRFFVQVAFSAIVLTFSLYKLADPNQHNHQALYWGGVTGIMAWWMPSPGNGTNAQNGSRSEQEQLLPPAPVKANGKPPVHNPASMQALPPKTA